jgi:hypothetical protein
MAQAELAGQMVAPYLRLDLSFRVIQHYVVAAPARGVATAGGQLAASEPRQRPLAGQLPRRHSVLVVDGAGNDRVIRIAIEPLHDDFRADARMAGQALFAAGPVAAYTYPATAGFVPIPVKPDLDTAVLVDIQAALAFRADHDGGLQGQQPGRHTVEAAPGKPRHVLALAKHAIPVLGKYILTLQIVVAGFVMHFQNQEFAVFAFTEMVKQLEPPAGSDAPVIATCFVQLAAGFDFLHAQP